MTSEFLANFRSEKQLTLLTGAKGKWIGTGANKRLDTYYNNGKCPQRIMQNIINGHKETDSNAIYFYFVFFLSFFFSKAKKVRRCQHVVCCDDQCT